MTNDFQLDDTQPNPAVAMPNLIRMDEGEPTNSGPGCLLWGMVGVFMLIVALATVIMASLAGWNDGYKVAIGNATATTAQDLQAQCALIPNDLASGAFGLANVRAESLMAMTPMVDCLVTLAPQMTQAYRNAMLTLTPPATATTQAIEATPTPTLGVVVSPAPTSSSGFDPNALLVEAQSQIAAGDNLSAIDTLDAISAIDPTFQKPLIDQLIFSALTSEARDLYLTGTNLAQAITLTDRAELYGDIGELNYERYIADLWLQAQAYSGVNYPKAIQLLSQIVYEQGLPNYRNAQVELFNQYVAYADALFASGDPCGARSQYDTALTMYNNGEVQGKRGAADTGCSAGLVATTDPLAPTPDPANSGGSSGSGVAPIGQRP
jgi:tetratricopeptide (TPR) repeat protein